MGSKNACLCKSPHIINQKQIGRIDWNNYPNNSKKHFQEYNLFSAPAIYFLLPQSVLLACYLPFFTHNGILNSSFKIFYHLLTDKLLRGLPKV
jgi:hypothetical protein